MGQSIKAHAQSIGDNDSILDPKEKNNCGGLKYSIKDTGLLDDRKAEYDEYVQNALLGANINKHPAFILESVDQRILNGLQRIGQYANEKAVHEVTDNNIRHMRNSHGIEKEGRYGITTGDIQAIPYITSRANEVYFFPKNNKVGLLYVINGVDETFYVEEIQSGRVFSGKQMIKAPKGTIPEAYADVINNKKALIASLNDDNIPQVYAQGVPQSSAFTHSIRNTVQESNPGQKLSAKSDAAAPDGISAETQDARHSLRNVEERCLGYKTT